MFWGYYGSKLNGTLGGFLILVGTVTIDFVYFTWRTKQVDIYLFSCGEQSPQTRDDIEWE